MPLLSTRRLSSLLALSTLAVVSIGGARLAAADEPTPAVTAEQEKFFEDRVRPVLSAKCWKCHGPEKQESNLRLDRREALLAPTASGSATVVPGDPAKGLLIKAVRREGDVQMPPDEKERLTPPEIEALTAWVQAGAPWPKSAAPAAEPLSVAARAARDRQTHWAFQTVSPTPWHVARSNAWLRTGVDAYVAEQLEAANLVPSREADRRTLMRRATYDLIGLPPNPEDVEAFVADDAPDAYARLVDRLLASPHHGERWGRHWLDLARYADTKGYAFAAERRYPYAYTYRDYVIGALNADLPFNQFVIEQIAADRLPTPEGASMDAKKRLAALGFMTTGRKFNNAHDDIDDKIDVVARGLMGLTAGCARCHDHKYDAIPMDDYYSLYGVFASCHEPGELPLIGTSEQNEEYKKFETELNKLKADHDRYRAERHAAATETARRKTADYLARVLSGSRDNLLGKLAFLTLGPDDLRPKFVERWRDYLKAQAKPDHPIFGPWHDLAAIDGDNLESPDFVAKATPILDRWKAAAEGAAPGQINPLVKAALMAEPPTSKLDIARVYGKVFSDVFQQWRDLGGNPEAEAKMPEANRQLLQILIGSTSPTILPVDDTRGYLNRAERNQLTELNKKIEAYQASSPVAPPRAMVLAENGQPHNAKIFIRGNPARPGKDVPRQFLSLVAGDARQPFKDGSGRLELAQQIVAPTNPLTRRVLMNRIWMWHFGEPLVSTPSDFGIRTAAPPQRALLEYLAARLLDSDWSLKAMHRELVLSSTFRQSSDDRADCRNVDPENRLYWRMNRRRLEFETLRDTVLALAGQLDTSLYGRPVELTKSPATPRRAVYGYVDRQDLPNLFRVFDFASPDQSSDRRPRTTVPQQSLFLMNSPFLIEEARALAARPEVTTQPDDDARIAALYRVVFARPAAPEEMEIGRHFLATTRAATSEQSKLDPWQQLAQLLLLTNEVCFVD